MVTVHSMLVEASTRMPALNKRDTTEKHSTPAKAPRRPAVYLRESAF